LSAQCSRQKHTTEITAIEIVTFFLGLDIRSLGRLATEEVVDELSEDAIASEHYHEQDLQDQNYSGHPEQAHFASNRSLNSSGATISDDNMLMDWALARWSMHCDAIMKELLRYWDDAANGKIGLLLATTLATLAMSVIDVRLERIKLDSIEAHLLRLESSAESIAAQWVAQAGEVSDDFTPFVNSKDQIAIYQGINKVTNKHSSSSKGRNAASDPNKRKFHKPDAFFCSDRSVDSKVLSAYTMMEGLNTAFHHDCLWEYFNHNQIFGPEYL
jgi:hypothetical protein